MELKLYLKSGNSITTDKVSEWNVKCNGNEVVSLSVSYKESPKERLIMTSLDLSQIEAITEIR